jgi:hypothetical protein
MALYSILRIQKIRTSEAHISCHFFSLCAYETRQHYRGIYVQLRGILSVILPGLPLIIPSQYRRIAGTEVVVPIMSLGEDLKRLSLVDGGCSKDPILLASTEGRPPTFKDVKKSLKV